MRLLHFVFFSLGLPLILQATASNIEDLSVKDKSNVTKPKLEPGDTDTKTTTPIGIEPLICSEENNESEENALITFLKAATLNPPIQNVFFKYITDIYTYDCKSKTLMINCVSRSTEISILLYDIRSGFSTEIVKRMVLKNLFIGYAIIKTIKYFLSCYRDTLEVLNFDHCFFTPNFAIQYGLNLEKLHTAKITHCVLDDKILKNILDLFPSSLQTLELSYLCNKKENDNYVVFGDYLTLNFLDLNVHVRFPRLKNLSVKENDIENFQFENLKNLEEFEANDKLYKSFDLTTELKKMKDLKRIKTDEYDLKDYLNSFVKRNFIVDNNTPIEIRRDDLPNIRKILSTFKTACFCFDDFTINDINFIPLENESNFENLKDVKFCNFKHTHDIAFMNCILTRFHGIHTITVILHFKDITAEQITASFNEIENYDKIENVHFNVNVISNAPAPSTCEFIIQILKRVPNLRSLSFGNMNPGVIDMLFNRLQNEKLKFPNLKKIDTKYCKGSIDLLLWFIQTFDIEELNIESSKLECYSNELLNNFSNKTLKKLRIISTTIDNPDLLKKFFSNMKKLKELHLLSDPHFMKLFEDNSIIEKVTFEYYYPGDKKEPLFAILKTFKILKYIYIKYDARYHSSVASAFKKHFKDKKVEDREVDLSFYSEPRYFE